MLLVHKQVLHNPTKNDKYAKNEEKNNLEKTLIYLYMIYDILAKCSRERMEVSRIQLYRLSYNSMYTMLKIQQNHKVDIKYAKTATLFFKYDADF